MLALLLAVALIALTVLALMLAGVVAAIVTGIALLNVFAVVLALGSRRSRDRPSAPPPERWRPSAFRRPPQPPLESDDEEQHPLTVHRR